MVEWKTLRDVAVIKNGKDYKNLSPGEIPVYGSGGIMTYVNQFASDKPSVLLPRKGSVENIFYVEEPFWTVDTIYWTDIDTSKIIPKYLYISLQQYNLKEFAYGGARPSLSQQILYNLSIPIPSLSEQTRIVGILDTFTASIDNLKEQIVQRRKQYEYYRDELLDFSNDNRMVWKLLGSVFPFIRNGFVGTVTPYFTNMENGVRYLEGTNIHNGTISDNTLLYVTHDFHQKHQKSKLKADDILMVQSGHIGECAIVGEKYQGANCHALIIMSNGGFCNSKFIVHYFHTYNGLKSLSPAITGGAIKHVLAKKVGKILVPVPSLEEQSRIVSILDTFEASIQNLEAQLKEREKQYEYYRNKLLTFE